MDTARHPLEPVPEVPKLPEKIWEKLTAWRREWSEIWYLRLGGRYYVYRSPTRQDAINHDLNARTMPARAIDDFVGRCLLYPEQMPANMPLPDLNTLYRAIWESSGFHDPEAFFSKLLLFDGVVRSAEQENVLLLLKAFPGLLPDTINSWQPEKIIYHIALARYMLGAEPIKEPKKKRPPNSPPPSVEVSRVGQQLGTQTPGAAFDWEEDLKEMEAFRR